MNAVNGTYTNDLKVQQPKHSEFWMVFSEYNKY